MSMYFVIILLMYVIMCTAYTRLVCKCISMYICVLVCVCVHCVYLLVCVFNTVLLLFLACAFIYISSCLSLLLDVRVNEFKDKCIYIFPVCLCVFLCLRNIIYTYIYIDIYAYRYIYKDMRLGASAFYSLYLSLCVC